MVTNPASQTDYLDARTEAQAEAKADALAEKAEQAQDYDEEKAFRADWLRQMDLAEEEDWLKAEQGAATANAL